MRTIKTTAVAATAIAAGLTAAVLGLAAPATATETETGTGSGSAQQTISNLEAKGYRVIVSNPHSTPLANATVVNVRKANDVTGWTWDIQHEHLVKEVLYTNVFVDVR